MEKTITFIAEYKKREFEQLKDDIEVENVPTQEQKDLDLEPNVAD